MATEFNRETLPLEVERLQTSIKYHDWFLGFVVIVGVSFSIYLVNSINTLQEGLYEVRGHILAMQKDIEKIQVDIDTIKVDIDTIHADIDALNQKMDRHHRDADPL